MSSALVTESTLEKELKLCVNPHSASSLYRSIVVCDSGTPDHAMIGNRSAACAEDAANKPMRARAQVDNQRITSPPLPDHPPTPGGQRDPCPAAPRPPACPRQDCPRPAPFPESAPAS